MLILKRNLYFNQLEKCSVSGEWIYPGEYYYEDDKDGIIIKATVYKELQNRDKEQNWDYSQLNLAQNELEYRRQFKEYTKKMLEYSALKRKVAGKLNNQKEDEEIQALYDMAKNKNMFFLNNQEEDDTNNNEDNNGGEKEC